jgi:hypothetical protein
MPVVCRGGFRYCFVSVLLHMCGHLYIRHIDIRSDDKLIFAVLAQKTV